jgi:crossover junction endodeoxyribonuclease RuvC
MSLPRPPRTRRVLGLDPGTLKFGWGVVEKLGPPLGNKFRHVAHGIIRTHPDDSLPERLLLIEDGLTQILTNYAPNEVSMEALFFAKDAQAAAKLGHARGVAMLVCARAALPIAEYPPARIKLTVAGNGRAEKLQVANMVKVLLSLRTVPQADAADALAAAVAHLQRTILAAR